MSAPPVVHLELRISPPIFEKIRNGPIGILRGLGELIHEKNRSQKSRDTVPLRQAQINMKLLQDSKVERTDNKQADRQTDSGLARMERKA